ncbi:MAG: ATP synthase F1 subunit delta [Phycisphaeraceae bacterium]|nr:ATP synthase F1 subunit delta [Phycisphaeraceae bacterium]
MATKQAKQEQVRLTPAAKVYARSLLEMAVTDGQFDVAVEEAGELAALLRVQPELVALLSTPLLSAKDRQESLERIFKGRISDLMLRFLQVVNHKGRLGELEAIFAAFQGLAREHKGVEEVQAEVARELSDAEANQVSEAVGAAMHRKIVLRQRVDPALIGGLRLRMGDRLIDGSVAARLRLMRRQIEQNGREWVRKNIGRLAVNG